MSHKDHVHQGEVETSLGYVVRATFGAITDGKDDMFQLRFSRCCEHTCLAPPEGELGFDVDRHGLLIQNRHQNFLAFFFFGCILEVP